MISLRQTYSLGADGKLGAITVEVRVPGSQPVTAAEMRQLASVLTQIESFVAASHTAG